MRDLLTIIISIFNKESFLEKTLWSVRNLITRDLFEIEIVLIDDGSTDNSYNIASSFDFGDKKNITLIKNESNLGVCKSLNKALKVAKGNYVYFLDADDLVMRLGLVMLYKSIKSYDADMSVGIVQQTDRNLNIMQTFRNIMVDKSEFIDYIQAQNLVDDVLWFRIALSHIGMIFRRDLLESFGGFEQKMSSSQDLYLILNSILNAKRGLSNTNTLVGFYRQSKLNPSSKEDEQSLWVKSLLTGNKIKDYQILQESIKDKISLDQYNRISEITNMLKNISVKYQKK